MLLLQIYSSRESLFPDLLFSPCWKIQMQHYEMADILPWWFLSGVPAVESEPAGIVLSRRGRSIHHWLLRFTQQIKHRQLTEVGQFYRPQMIIVIWASASLVEDWSWGTKGDEVSPRTHHHSVWGVCENELFRSWHHLQTRMPRISSIICIWCGSSFTETTMLFHYDSAVAQNRQAKHWIQGGPYAFWCYPKATVDNFTWRGEGEATGI